MATQEQIGKHLDLSARRVRELMQAGILKKGGGLDENRVAYIRHLRSKAGNGAGNFDLTRERALLARAQREKIELDMEERTGRLLPVEVIREIGVGLVTATRAKLLSVHHRIKQRFPHLEIAIIDEIKRLHTEALEELADGDIPEEALDRIRRAEARNQPPEIA